MSNDQVRAALVALVEVQNLRERAEKINPVAPGVEKEVLMDEWRRRIPHAWKAAREALAEPAMREQNIDAQMNSPAPGSQQVLKAEAATPDATDREPQVIESPIGGSMGAGQPAAAGPIEASVLQLPPLTAIAECSAIMALTDAYEMHPTSRTRTDLRCALMTNRQAHDAALAALREQNAALLRPIPVNAIGALLSEAMGVAVSNGASSVSMPDDLVEIAVWLAAITKAKL